MDLPQRKDADMRWDNIGLSSSTSLVVIHYFHWSCKWCHSGCSVTSAMVDQCTSSSTRLNFSMLFHLLLSYIFAFSACGWIFMKYIDNFGDSPMQWTTKNTNARPWQSVHCLVEPCVLKDAIAWFQPGNVSREKRYREEHLSFLHRMGMGGEMSIWNTLESVKYQSPIWNIKES